MIRKILEKIWNAFAWVFYKILCIVIVVVFNGGKLINKILEKAGWE